MFVLVTGCRWRETRKVWLKINCTSQVTELLKVWKNILSGAIKSAYKSGNLQLQRISVDSSTVKKEAM